MSRKIEVGRIIDGRVFPVKSLQSVQMDTLQMRSVSVVGDRRVAFTEVNSQRTPNLLDTTKFPGLLRYIPRFENPNRPQDSEIIIRTPEGNEYSIYDKKLLQQIEDESKRKLAILSMGRAAYHSMPVSLMTLGSVRRTENQVGSDIDRLRFRENIYVETEMQQDLPYPEDEWVGKMLVFGDSKDAVKLVVLKLDKRCATVNYHPRTGETNPNVLKTIVKNHNNTLGVYCAIVGEGTIEVNSPVYLVPLSL